MSNILLSFCIPTYNRPDRISVIIKSLISLQSKEIEIVISDDNPLSNRTQESVKEFTDPRVKYYRNKINLGFDSNMLKTIMRARGEYVFINMDEDDIELDTIPWILEKIKENKNLTHLIGCIGDKRPYYKGDYKKDLKVVKTKPRTFEGILKQRYIFREYYNYFRGNLRFRFKDKFYKCGSESIKELFFYYPHGSGIVLKKNVLNLNQAKNYIGFLFMQQALIAQALIKGDTLSTSKIFAHFGEVQYKSDQPLFKGKSYYHPIYGLLRNRYKVQIIYDITKEIENSRKLKKFLLNKLKDEISDLLLMLLCTKNTKNFIFLSSDFKFQDIFFNLIAHLRSLKSFIEGLSIVFTIKRAKSPFFWFYLITKPIKDLLKLH